MGNMEYVGENVLRVTAMVTEDVEKRLKHLPEVQEITTRDEKTYDNCSRSWKIVCEDPRLSIPYVGKTIRVLNMNLAEAPPSVLPLEEFGLLLSICAASLDIEAVMPDRLLQKKIKNAVK